MDLVIPRGTRLFHGTIEPFDLADLTVGGYDNVLWTADNACIAQSYIPCGGGTSLISVEHLDRPSQDRSTQIIQARFGLDFGYGTDRGPEFDPRTGRALSWRTPAPWLDGTDSRQRKNELKRRVLEAGWQPMSENGDVFGFKFNGGKLLDPGQCAEGRLFILTVEQDLKVFDKTSGGRVQGDLTDVDYHKLGAFRSAERSGYDAVKINDYAQSEMWGNVGHTSVGIFKDSIKKLSWNAITAKNFDWPDWETLQRGMTPELEAWLAGQSMTRRNTGDRISLVAALSDWSDDIPTKAFSAGMKSVLKDAGFVLALGAAISERQAVSVQAASHQRQFVTISAERADVAKRAMALFGSGEPVKADALIAHGVVRLADASIPARYLLAFREGVARSIWSGRKTNPQRNADEDLRRLERAAMTGDDEARQRLCGAWDRLRAGKPPRPIVQPHAVKDAEGWSQIVEFSARHHLKADWERQSGSRTIPSGELSEASYDALEEAAPDFVDNQITRVTLLETPRYESYADLTGEEWWNYLVKIEGSIYAPDVDENPRRRNRPKPDLSRITIRVCDDADSTRTGSRRAYAHTFCKKGPVVCVASEFFGLPGGHRDGVLAHELGHLLAGPDAGEEAADRAFEAETGVRIRYKDGAHGRCLQWLGPKARKSLIGVFKFDFEGQTTDAHGPDDDAVRFFVKDAKGKRELATLEEAEAVAAEDLEAEVWATDGQRRLGWRPMARNPHKRGALVPLEAQIRHGVDLHGLPARRNAVCPVCGATDAYKSPFSGRMECRVCDAAARRPKTGARVRLAQDVNRYPHFVAKKGSTGVVTHSDDESLWVKMDKHLDGAEEWDNEVQWFDESLGDIESDVEVLAPVGVRRNARSPDAWKTPPPCDTEATGKPLTAAIAKRLADSHVRVHLNLHNGCYVFTSRGKVTAYARFFYLKDVLPRVGVGGYRRCHELKVRNVHAYLEGTFVDGAPPTKRGKGWRQITYNCKTNQRPCFYFVDNDECFEGAAEVRAWRLDNGDGTERCEVWVKGAPPERKKNPPECRCELPGGACACGAVDDECARVVADARCLK